VSFAAPQWLLAMGLLLPLLVAYLVRRRRQVVKVPSVLRWRRVALSRHRNRRFRFLSRLVSMLLCVAALMALVLATARPTGASAGETLAIVVDVSASMGTREDGPLAEAIEEIEGVLAARGPIDRVLLVEAGETPRRLAGPTDDPSLLWRGLEELRPATEADVPAALALADRLLAQAPSARAVLYHDGGALNAEPTVELELEERRLGGSRANVGITTLAARPAPSAISEEDRVVLVAVAAAGERPRRAEVTLEAEGVTVGSLELEVPPGGEADARFELRLPAREVRAVVRAIDGGGDDLPGDDAATLALARSRPPRVALVGGDEASRFFAEHALRAAGVPEIVEDVDASEVAVVLGAPARRYDVPTLILGGLGTEETGHWPEDVEVVGPLEGEGTRLRSIEERHPITRGVTLDGVTIVRALAIDPGRGERLVELDGAGDGGTVVAAGGQGAGRWAYLGLEPGGSDVVLRVAYPVLVANALSWLGGATELQVTTTPPRSEVALRGADDAPALRSADSPWRLPTLPAVLAVLAALSMLIEGVGWWRGWLR